MKSNDVDELMKQYLKTRDIETRNRIVELYMPLVGHVLKSKSMLKYLHYAPYEDLEQVGMLAVIESVERFDPKRNTALATMIGNVINGRVKDYYRQQDFYGKGDRKKEKNGNYRLPPVEVYAEITVGNKPDKTDQAIASIEFAKCISNKLDERKKQVFDYFYFDRMKMREIGNLLGVTESRICQIISEIRERHAKTFHRFITGQGDSE